MTKTKNDTPVDHDNTTEGHANKRAKTTATENEEDVRPDHDINSETAKTKSVQANSDTSVAEGSNAPLTVVDSSSTTAKVLNKGGQAITVKTIIPHPTKQFIDNDDVKEYDDVLLVRLHRLLEYMNSKANIYALGKLLPTATWGQYKPVNDRSKILCDPVTGDPITIWVVGRITKMWFMKFDKPENQVMLTIMPLSKTLAQQSALLLAKFSAPVLSLNQQTSHTIRAIKWQNVQGGDPSSEALLFDAVYDARRDRSLTTYSERPIWNLTDLKPGDLVLLEMKMTRYSKKHEDNKWHSQTSLKCPRILKE
ncbi:hypothetical protein DFH29DRAFT_876201 [Suillus ampliporus]|nr:hypothetical protein DFH29DRAFT_876201 [Suillus ampliporus]